MLLVGYDIHVPYITLRMSVNPLVNFMWLGGLFLVLGGLCVVSIKRKPFEEIGERKQRALKLGDKQLSKSFGPQRVLLNLDLSLQSGEIVCLLGQNGVGKPH